MWGLVVLRGAQRRALATAATPSGSVKAAKPSSQVAKTVAMPTNYKQVTIADGKTLFAYEGKLKNTFKRAGHLMEQLDKELVQHAKNTLHRPQWDFIKPGDAVEVLYKETGISPRSQMASGVCIGTKRVNGYNASVRVMSVLGPHPIEYHFPVFSPLVSHIRLVQERFIHKGQKRVKRAKLYYMRDRPIGELRTPPSEFTRIEKERALAEARRVSAEAKMGKKEKAERDAKKKA